MWKYIVLVIFSLTLFSCGGNSADIATDDEGILYPFKSGGMWGYLDRDFNIVVPAEYERTHPFEDGMGLITPRFDLDLWAEPISLFPHLIQLQVFLLHL